MATKRQPTAPRVNSFLNQALMEASTQIDPQADALLSMLAGKRRDYINTRRVNASNARGIAAGARQADANVQSFYGSPGSAPSSLPTVPARSSRTQTVSTPSRSESVGPATGLTWTIFRVSFVRDSGRDPTASSPRHARPPPWRRDLDRTLQARAPLNRTRQRIALGQYARVTGGAAFAL